MNEVNSQSTNEPELIGKKLKLIAKYYVNQSKKKIEESANSCWRYYSLVCLLQLSRKITFISYRRVAANRFKQKSIYEITK